MTDMIEIDGSQGEGGGQIIRSALALSLVTGKPFAVRKIRANRDKPGLKRQHLTACNAAARVGCAHIEGAELGSRELTFRPAGIFPSVFNFDVETAGATILVAQTIIPALMIADGPSRVTIDGGTHNNWAPPFDFMDRVYLPLVNRLGPTVTARLDQHGFYPAGRGRVSFSISPGNLKGFDLMERGESISRRVIALVSNLPLSIASREVDTAIRRLGWSPNDGDAREVESAGPGNIVMIQRTYEHVSEITTSIGRIGLPAEKVAANAVRDIRNYEKRTAPVGEYLADQWMLPLAITVAKTGVPHAFRTFKLSQHSTTHIDIIQMFLPISFTVEPLRDLTFVVRIQPSA